MHLERCARRGSAPMRGAIGDRSIFSSLVPYVCDPSSVIDGLAKSMCPELRFSPQLRFTMVKEWPPSLGAAKGGRAKRMTPHRSSVRLAEHSCIYRTSLVVTLLPGDVISLRLLRHKREVVFNLHTLYYQGVRAQVAAEKSQAP